MAIVLGDPGYFGAALNLREVVAAKQHGLPVILLHDDGAPEGGDASLVPSIFARSLADLGRVLQIQLGRENCGVGDPKRISDKRYRELAIARGGRANTGARPCVCVNACVCKIYVGVCARSRVECVRAREHCARAYRLDRSPKAHRPHRTR